jgi:hypothetical protein
LVWGEVSTWSIQIVPNELEHCLEGNHETTARVRKKGLLLQHLPWLHLNNTTVFVADDGTAFTVFQDGVNVQPNMLAARITANEVRSVNEGGINFDRITWLRTEEAVLGNEWDNCKWTALGDAAN